MVRNFLLHINIKNILIQCLFFINAWIQIESQNSSHMKCEIFCHGNILHEIQMSNIFNDSKYFVDMKMKFRAPKIKRDFKTLMNQNKNHPSKAQLLYFLKDNFNEPGGGFLNWIPNDWKDKPAFVEDIYDPDLRNWIIELNKIWKKLGRQLSPEVQQNNDLYSFLYVPHPFIVPGGRFEEFYYWDSYWIIEGLILSDMLETAKGMILNFLFMVKTIGYIPNGGRKYYLERSQPPFLIPMVYLYWKATKDITFLENSIPLLEKEFDFWLKNRSSMVEKDGLEFRVFQYKVKSTRPRPESYFEDFSRVHNMTNDQKIHHYTAIKSAAESGWDFSSRWFANPESSSSNLLDIDTEAVVPVCLNSIIGYNAKLLSQFFLELNDISKAKSYHDIAYQINNTISRLFWNDDYGIWFDYNIKTKSNSPIFYMSNFMPLWTEMYGTEHEKSYTISRVLNYISKEKLLNYPGGIPTSLKESSQQWNFPNGWAPLQYFLVLGLDKANSVDNRAGDLALSIARKWILSGYSAYKNLGLKMYEKYDVTQFGVPGKGGEYLDQEGFGWTNGVAIKFMSIYPHQIRTSEVNDPAPVLIGSLMSNDELPAYKTPDLRQEKLVTQYIYFCVYGCIIYIILCYRMLLLKTWLAAWRCVNKSQIYRKDPPLLLY